MVAEKEYTPSPWLRRSLVLLALTVLAMFATVALAVTDSGTADDRRGLADVSFGRPVDWLHQDITSRDLVASPRDLGPGLPQEYPTTLSVGPFVVTAGTVLIGELSLLGAISFVLRHKRHRY